MTETLIAEVLIASLPAPQLSLIRRLAVIVLSSHRHGILHLDIKPGNVRIDASETPLMADCGHAAKIWGYRHGRTPGSRAPEKRFSAQCDCLLPWSAH